MTPWVVIQLANLNTYLEQGLVSVLNTKDLAPGQTDRFTQAVNDVTAEVRATIQSYKSGFVVSATPNSVPPELVRYTCYLIILAMQGSCPALILDKDKRAIFEKAYDWMDMYRTGEMRPTTPPDPQASDVQGFPSAEVARGHFPEVNRHSMRGI